MTITANNLTKTYGQAVTFAGTEFTPNGLLNADTVTNVTLTSTGAVATATVAGSPYAIVPSAATGERLLASAAFAYDPNSEFLLPNLSAPAGLGYFLRAQ